MWAVPQAVCVIIVFWVAAAATSDVELEFISEPISRLVKIRESRAVFRCEASPPSAEIRWLYKGIPVSPSMRWIRVSDHKLTVLLGRMDRIIKSPHELNNVYFQCEIRLRGQVLVSAPAKLTVAVLDGFPAQPDAHLETILGNTAVIPCDPPHSEPLVVTEFNFNQTIIATSTERQKLMPSGDLQIINTTYADSGEYRCIANNPYLVKTVVSQRKVILHVRESSKLIPPYFVKSPRSRLAVALGSNVTLECVVNGFPVPKVTWQKRHDSLPHSRHKQLDGNLLIINMKKSDEGTYHCQAENSAGPKISESIHVEVQESPQIVRPPRTVTVEVGDNITLNCGTRGHPKPTLTWIHNGRTITGPHTKRSPLVILNANVKHSGIYQCFASNNLGTVYASMLVIIRMDNNSFTSDYDDIDDEDDDDYDDIEELMNLPKPHHGRDKGNDYDALDPVKEENHHPPKKIHKKKHKGVKLIPPSRPYVTRLSNSSVMIRWNVPRNDGLPVIFFKVQYKEVGRGHTDWETVEEDIAAHIHSYAVTDLKPGAVYRFQIAAVYSNNDNKSGPMSAKFVLLKDSPMEKPSPAPVITFAEAASPSAITLYWEHEQKPSVPVVGYFIHYRATHTAGKYLKVTVLGSSTRSHTVTHLLPETGYDMKMQSFNDAGTSEFSNIYTSKTKPAEVIPGTRPRNKAHQSEGSDISLTETVSSKNSESNVKLYIIIGSVFGVLLLIVLSCMLVFFKQKHSMEAACDNDNESEREDTVKVRNGYGNGYVPVNKINISVNPLSHLGMEDEDKPDELEDIVSNNNEIIRLQTFNVNTDHTVDPICNGIEVIESEFNGDEQNETVIVSCNSGIATE